jgi:DNA-directed RNA polymerase subunit N (RpoN/RPB10)
MSLKSEYCTCRKVLSSSFRLFEKLTKEDGFSEADALSELGLGKDCCQSTVLKSIDIMPRYESVIKYDTGLRYTHTEGHSSKAKEEKARKVPDVRHLGNYKPETFEEFDPNSLFLTVDSSVKKQDIDDELPNPVHWEERKRLLSVIWFLNTYTKPGTQNRVLWIGAGGLPTSCIEYLLSLFPNHSFILLDREGINSKKLKALAQKNDRLEVKDTEFDDDMAEDYTNEVELFISEYRTADENRGSQAYQIDLDKDQINQLNWYINIAPNAALLLYQPPSIPKTENKYLDGRCLLPPWSAANSLEFYMAVESVEETDYTYYDYKSTLAILTYHNRVDRTSAWQHRDIKESHGIDSCWDCAAEDYILSSLVKKQNPSIIVTSLISKVIQMSLQISLALDPKQSYTLLTPPQDDDGTDDLTTALVKVKL